VADRDSVGGKVQFAWRLTAPSRTTT